MRIRRAAFAVAALWLAMPGAAAAQLANPQRTQIQFQYHELVPAGSDTAPVYLKIFSRIRKDCELVGKAFDRKCVIKQINIYSNVNYNNLAPTKMLNATASVVLLGAPAGAAAPAAPGAPPVK